MPLVEDGRCVAALYTRPSGIQHYLRSGCYCSPSICVALLGCIALDNLFFGGTKYIHTFHCVTIPCCSPFVQTGDPYWCAVGAYCTRFSSRLPGSNGANALQSTPPPSCSIPVTYLHCVQWVDSHKPIFNFSMSLLSSVHSTDPVLRRFESAIPRYIEGKWEYQAECVAENVEALANLPPQTCVSFFPSLCSALFKIMCTTENEAVGTNSLSALHGLINWYASTPR